MNKPDTQLPKNIQNSFDELIKSGEPAPLVVAFQSYLAGKRDASPQEIKQFCGLMERIPSGQDDKNSSQLEEKIFDELYKKYHQRLAARAAASSAPRSSFQDMREENPREALSKLIDPAPQTTIKFNAKELPRECVDILSIATALFSSQHSAEVTNSFIAPKRKQDESSEMKSNLDASLVQRAMREGVKEVFFQRREEPSDALRTQMGESHLVIQMRQESRARISSALEKQYHKARASRVIDVPVVGDEIKPLLLDSAPPKAHLVRPISPRLAAFATRAKAVDGTGDGQKIILTSAMRQMHDGMQRERRADGEEKGRLNDFQSPRAGEQVAHEIRQRHAETLLAAQQKDMKSKSYAPVPQGELRDPFELDVKIDPATVARREQLKNNLTNGAPQQLAEGQLPNWEEKFAAKAAEVQRKLSMKADQTNDGNGILTSVGAMLGGIGQRVVTMPEKVAGILKVAKSSVTGGTQGQNR